MVNENISVHDEQFDEENNSVENMQAKAEEKEPTEEEDSQKLKETSAGKENKTSNKHVKADAEESIIENSDNDSSDEKESKKSETIKTKVKKQSTQQKTKKESKDKTVEKSSEEKTEDTITENKNVEDFEDIEPEDKNEITIRKKENGEKEAIDGELLSEEKESDESSVEENKKDEKIEKPDYSAYDKEQLVQYLENLLLGDSVENIGEDADTIKLLFYKKHKTELEKTKSRFLEEGGNLEDFKPSPDPQEAKLKDLLVKYKNLKSDFNRKLEEDKKFNLEEKYRVIEEIKDLVNRKESINKTFQDFRELQQKWRDVGLVPQQNVKDLWESYHLACEMFYDYIKINKELRDLDLKKNMEIKITLCEKAEKLLLEPSVVNAFKILQTLHEQWREIGPVPLDKKTEIWERFKDITSKINKRHHQYFENLKENQKKNLEEKTILCEKVEEIDVQELKTAKEWEDKSKEIIEIQKIWKTIGFAPKKDNTKIYNRFRTACDNFFNHKREFFTINKEEQKNNLQLKTDLCVQAETLKDNTDWKNTTEELISLQKRWKEIGPVPKKYSDQVWRRFRSACDTFFDRKSNFFSNIDSSYEENLKKKNELIEEIKNYEIVKSIENNFKNIGEFQKRWTEIGFVPIQNKEEVQTRYREAINNLFDKLKVDDDEKNILKFNNRLNDIYSKPNTSQKIKQERDKLIKKLTTLENDVVVWENNIGFFSKSKNANSLIKDVKAKIENGKRSIELLKMKIRTIDEFKEENNIE